MNCDMVGKGVRCVSGMEEASPVAVTPLFSPKLSPRIGKSSSVGSSLLLSGGRSLSTAPSTVGSSMSPGSTGTLSIYEEDNDSIQEMWMSVTNMTRLLDDVLSLQRIEDGELILERAPFYLQDTATGVVRMMTTWLDNKGLKVDIHVDPSLNRLVLSDEYRLRQILLNFLSNAIRFTPVEEGTTQDIQLRIETCPAFTSQEPIVSDHWPEAGHSNSSPSSASSTSPSSALSPVSPGRVFLRLSVRDRGIGISMEDLHRLFRPFVQISSGEAEKGKGTGLGLSIGRKLIEMLGGRIGVISAPGQGSEFFVETQFELLHPFSEGGSGGSAFDQITSTSPALSQVRKEELATTDVSSSAGFPRAESSSASANVLPKPLQVVTPPLLPSPPKSPSVSQPTAASNVIPRHPVHSTAALPLRAAPSIAPASLGYSLEAETAVKRSSSSAASPFPSSASSMPTPAAGSQKKVSAFSAGPRPLPVSTSSPTDFPPPSLRVLVVDDAESNRKFLARLVTKNASANCDQARDGREAVDLITGNVDRYDVILCDKEMPVLDGYGAVREMRRLGVTCPIIGVTANALLSDQAEFIACGLDALVTKPVNMGNLMKVMDEAIQQRLERQRHIQAGIAAEAVLG